MATRPYLLDCDTGVDDALALAHLLSDPEVNLVGITTVSGNTSAEQATENTLRLLTLAGRTEIPVATGEHDFLTHAYDGGVPFIHGDNGLGNIDLPEATVTAIEETGPEFIVRMAHTYPGELHLIPIGPFTNLAKALELDPELPKLIKHVTVMGGAALAPGNVSAVAEANIWNDPEAAEIVFNAGWPVTMVGLDITMTELFEESDRQKLLEASGTFTPTLGNVLKLYFDFYEESMGRSCSALHDPLAVGIATGEITPVVAPIVDVHVDITDGPGRGQTIADLRGVYNGYPEQPGATVRVVLTTDKPYAPILLDRLLSITV
jgi:purine nucleosidase